MIVTLVPPSDCILKNAYLYLSTCNQGRQQLIIEGHHTTSESRAKQKKGEWSWLLFWLWSEVRYPPIGNSYDNIR